jgi:hypothetical protein
MNTKVAEELMKFLDEEPAVILKTFLDGKYNPSFIRKIGKMYGSYRLISRNYDKERERFGKLISPSNLETSIMLICEMLNSNRHTFYEEKDGKARKDHHYEYIPLNEKDFYLGINKTVEELKKRGFEAKRFIDIGCGMRDKSYLAYIAFGLEPHGIEYTQSTFEEGERKYSCYGQYNFYRGDALEYDYSKYDINYMYCPMSHPEPMQKLYFQVINTMKVGSAMVSFLTMGHELFEAIKQTGLSVVQKPDRGNSVVAVIKTSKGIEVVGLSEYIYKQY